MIEYRVTWTIDLEADSPRVAALAALAIQRDQDSIATVFEVAAIGDGMSVESSTTIDVA
ncbi:MAG: hypothetical protein V3S43_06200 [Acidimicrobiia bacterium]